MSCLTNQYGKRKIDNHDMLLYVIDALKYLTHQGQAIRGAHHENSEAHCEPNSNIWQVMKLQGQRDSRVNDLRQRRINYCSAPVQNELISIMSRLVLQDLALEIRSSKFYAIMVDETSDITSTEQAAICFRFHLNYLCAPILCQSNILMLII